MGGFLSFVDNRVKLTESFWLCSAFDRGLFQLELRLGPLVSSSSGGFYLRSPACKCPEASSPFSFARGGIHVASRR